MTKPIRKKKPELTIGEKPVQLAKDIVLQLINRRYDAARGVVCTAMEGDYQNKEKNAQKALAKVKACSVCAKGALFIAYIERWNKVTTTELVKYSSSCSRPITTKGFIDVIGETLQAEIETLFERRSFEWNVNLLGEDRVNKLVSFSKESLPEDTNERLLILMFRLIANHGSGVI